MLKAVALPIWRHIRAEHPEIALRVEYVRRFGRYPRWAHPHSFNEKVRLKMIYDRRPQLAVFADKRAVRDFVLERLGDDRTLPALLAQFESARDIARASIAPPFVMKASHGSGWVKIVMAESAPSMAALARVATGWLAHDYSRECREICYRGLPRAVLFEELLVDADGTLPADYKLFCFDGTPRFVQVDRDRATRHRQSFFDLDWRPLPVRYLAPNIEGPVERPRHFDAMIDIASKLSRGSDFVRVDLYDLPDRVVFGEMTNYPNTGDVAFDPPAFDDYLGSFWDYSRERYRARADLTRS